jgi:hypothetical protein
MSNGAWRTLVRLAHAVDLAKTGLTSEEAYALLDRVEAGEAVNVTPMQAAIVRHYLESER